MLGATSKPVLVNRSGFSSAVYDHDGRLLRLTGATDEHYRLWVPLADIPPAMIDATLIQEDAWFRWHPGVNPLSLVRASCATYINRDRRIGGSTITMQLARYRFGIDSRTLRGKLQQIARAFQLERFYSKDQILEAYLNTVPYGGNIEGVGAASIVYFGKQARYLSVPEALTLAVIPQSPGARNPALVSERDALEKASLRLARKWRRVHRTDDPDFFRSLRVTASSRHSLPFRAPHFVDDVLESANNNGGITTTLDIELQEILERHVRAYLERNRRLGINNAALILVDYRTMEVKAYLGSANYFDESIQGQVNGLRAHRSPGSALKPFIYALAIDQGLIHPATMLKDTSVRIAAYNPENFDRDFLGPIDATSALVLSRNVPAIELTNILKPPGFYGFLKKAEIKGLREESFYGLAIALGGVEVSMEEMARLYAMLANGGVLSQLVKTTGPRVSTSVPVRMLSAEASFAVLQMLRTNPRPSNEFTTSQVPSGRAIPWKTGTSYGLRDAWAMGIVGPYVLGVWIGNFDGTPNANLIGREVAGPLFFNIVDALNARDPLVEPPVTDKLNIKEVKVCALSGQLPGPYCDHFKTTLFIPGKSPISTCSIHRGVRLDRNSGHQQCAEDSAHVAVQTYEFWPSDLVKLFHSSGLTPRTPPLMSANCRRVSSSGIQPLIASPSRGVVYSISDRSNREIAFTAVTDADSRMVYWFVDNGFVGTARSGESFMWKSRPGDFIVRAVDDQGRAVVEQLRVRTAAAQ